MAVLLLRRERHAECPWCAGVGRDRANAVAEPFPYRRSTARPLRRAGVITPDAR